MPWTICKNCGQLGHSAAAIGDLIRPCTCDRPDLVEVNARGAESYIGIVERLHLPPRGPRGDPSGLERLLLTADGVVAEIKRVLGLESDK